MGVLLFSGSSRMFATDLNGRMSCPFMGLRFDFDRPAGEEGNGLTTRHSGAEQIGDGEDDRKFFHVFTNGGTETRRNDTYA